MHPAAIYSAVAISRDLSYLEISPLPAGVLMSEDVQLNSGRAPHSEAAVAEGKDFARCTNIQ